MGGGEARPERRPDLHGFDRLSASRVVLSIPLDSDPGEYEKRGSPDPDLSTIPLAGHAVASREPSTIDFHPFETMAKNRLLRYTLIIDRFYGFKWLYIDLSLKIGRTRRLRPLGLLLPVTASTGGHYGPAKPAINGVRSGSPCAV